MMIALFAATIFCGSFLMFVMEPMVAKMLLPFLGGVPAVWNTCVMFFQLMLLAGYGAAHFGSHRLGTRRFSLVHVATVLAAAAMLPFGIPPEAAAAATDAPIFWTLRVLTQAIALPFLTLAVTGPLLQWWFSHTRHHSARDPYFLYAAGNAGSLMALMSYPAVVEPALRMGTQARVWTAGYVVFAGLTIGCAVVTWRHGSAAALDTPVRSRVTEGSRIPWPRRLYWVALAFIPSSLMLGVTAYLSTDIAPMPLLWIVPLSLYLLSFVVVFGTRGGTWRRVADRRLPVLVLPLAVFAVLNIGGPVWLLVPIHLLAFTMTAMLCHGALAEDRPSAELLTEFYVWMAVGGLIGGVFNSLIAPAIFNDLLEYPLVLVLACLVRRGDTTAWDRPRVRAVDVLYALGISALSLILTLLLRGASTVSSALLAIPAALALRQLMLPVRFALTIGGMFVAAGLLSTVFSDGQIIETRRTFFGVYRVSTDPAARFRELYHGNTLHGMQAIEGAAMTEPLTYYHRAGPFGELFDAAPAGVRQAVGVVGLGIGSLAAYVNESGTLTFYEIDPAVEELARNAAYFTHLSRCGDRCRVVLGDARIELAAAPSGAYGMLVLDAFSSDAIPSHLITSEAMSLYLTRLAPGGVLAFHISNRHLRLGPVLGRLAAHHGLTALERIDLEQSAATDGGKRPSNWVVMARDARSLGPLTRNARWTAPAVSESTPLWTDDFTNILSVFKPQ